MKTAYILLEDGFEEIEALATCDILRRGNVNCLLVGMKSKNVTGSHGIKIEADKVFDGQIVDMVILPGGLPGATNLQDNEAVIDYLNTMNSENKWIAAICAAPIVLKRANLINDLNVTSYPGYNEELQPCNYLEEKVVEDQNIITSRGPGTTFAFAYYLLEKLGKDTSSLKEGMLYND